MVTISYEEDVNVNYDKEIGSAIFKGGCPICKGDYEISINFKNGHSPTPYVLKVCHIEFVDVLNKRLPPYIQLNK